MNISSMTCPYTSQHADHMQISSKDKALQSHQTRLNKPEEVERSFQHCAWKGYNCWGDQMALRKYFEVPFLRETQHSGFW